MDSYIQCYRTFVCGITEKFSRLNSERMRVSFNSIKGVDTFNECKNRSIFRIFFLKKYELYTKSVLTVIFINV